MKQAVKKKREATTWLLQLHHRLREGLFIIISAITLYLFIALLTYHTSDPGWSQVGTSDVIQNSGGRTGAWFSDVFYTLFGYLAYLFPMMLAYVAWRMLRGHLKQDSFHLNLFIMRSIGFLLTLISGASIAELHFSVVNQPLPVGAGGVLGNALGHYLIPQFNYLGSTLLLLACFLAGVTLTTGLSWLGLMDRIGHHVLQLGAFVQHQWQVLCTYGAQCWAKQAERKAKRKANHLLPETIPLKIAPKEKRMLPVIATVPKAEVLKKKSPQSPAVLKPATGNGTFPSAQLLVSAEATVSKQYTQEELTELSALVEAKLSDFGVKAQVVSVHPGPVVTRFELKLAPGIKVSKVTSLIKDLARSLAVTSVRIVEIIPGRPVVGLELPNRNRQIVRLSELVVSDEFNREDSPLSIVLGKDIAGIPIIADLGKMPHLLVAGTTGSGKSVGLNCMLLSLLYKAQPEDVRLIMIDPKMLELSVYDDIPHLLTPVVTDMKEAASALNWCVAEMDRRYQLMAALGVRNVNGFNTKVKAAIKAGEPLINPLAPKSLTREDEPPEHLNPIPYIVVVVDEFADMIMVVGKKVEELIARIAQKARAAGIHMILATQRPSVDVITGLIKANVPSRIAFQVASRIDSRTILDQSGAEQLLGRGDMLYLPIGAGIPTRVHGAFVDDEEVHNVVSDWKQRGKPEYLDEILANTSVSGGLDSGRGEEDELDPLYDEAVYFVTDARRVSISMVQRRFKIGYNRAARLVEQMEVEGVVSAQGGKGREVLAPAPVKN